MWQGENDHSSPQMAVTHMDTKTEFLTPGFCRPDSAVINITEGSVEVPFIFLFHSPFQIHSNNVSSCRTLLKLFRDM